MLVLQRRGNSFLIRQLLVDCLFGGVCSGSYLDGYLEPRRQGTQKFHANRQSDQGGHAAVRDCGCEIDLDLIAGVVQTNETLLDHM